MGCIDVCLEQKGREIMEWIRCWLSAWWKEWGEKAETVERDLVGGLLWLGGNSWWCLCGNLLGMGARARTWWPESPHGSKMGNLSWLISCELLQLNPAAGGDHVNSQLSLATAWLLVSLVCVVYLVNKLALVFYGISSMGSRCYFRDWVWSSRTKLCCIASGKWNVSRVSIQEFDIRYRMLKLILLNVYQSLNG